MEERAMRDHGFCGEHSATLPSSMCLYRHDTRGRTSSPRLQVAHVMIIESGLIVAAGLLLTFFKRSWRARMWMLSHPLAMDVAEITVLTILHWRTFSGVMAATNGALMCSAMLTLGRWTWGHTKRELRDKRTVDVYHRGLFNMSSKLGIAPRQQKE
jgi:hypothetical protein